MKSLVIPTMLAVAALGLAGCGAAGPGSSPSARPGTASPTQSSPECPTAGGLDHPDTSDVVHLPAGAVGVRLCDLATTGPVLAPPGELVTGVGRLVEQFNVAESFDAETLVCTADAGPAYAMIFRYPDNTSVTVTSMLAGCRTVGGKLGGDALVATFGELVDQSRTASPQPPPAISEPCAGPRLAWVPVRTQNLVTVSACADATRTTATGGTTTAEQWAVLSADLATNVTEADDFWFAGEGTYYVATDRYGQPQELQRFGDKVLLSTLSFGSPQQKLRVWTPSPEALAVLDQLVG